MNHALLAATLILAAYLIGAIPFGYLIARWFKGIDIRTVGSGNIGATNVGRVLGFRFFCLVFLLDMAKGLLPTLGFPLLVERLTSWTSPQDFAVLVALASILGHNFPIYLSFKGGKGVATSLGAFTALDPEAGAAAAFFFLVFLIITRYVSLSAVAGGLVFFLAHFMRVREAWSREERAMSVITCALLLLLIIRHRKNYARIAAGTEPKVYFRKKREQPPAGRIAVSWLIALAGVAALQFGGAAAWKRFARREGLTVGRYTLAEVARAATGYQRAERVAFADGGKLLAVTCPRYNRLVLYRVTDHDGLEALNDLALEGKPVSVCLADDRLLVLERPPGDNRHVEPGWWQAYDLRGERLGEKVLVGYYPDDMVLSPDGQHAFVLTSGRGEGDEKKPEPALDVFEIAGGPKPVGHLSFEGKGDDPARLTLSAAGRSAAVTLLGSNMTAAVDLFDPARPRLIGRVPLAAADHPYPSRDAVAPDDTILMPVASGSEAVPIQLGSLGDCLAFTLPQGSALAFERVAPSPSRPRTESLGQLALHGGALGLGSTRPTGLAFSPERGLIAVANRSGGVHLVAIRANVDRLAASIAP